MRLSVKNILHFVLPVMLTAANCGPKQTAVNLSNICREEDQTDVQIRGFLHFSENTPHLPPKSALLVENRNGTGGFIKILIENAEVKAPEGEIKIIGKVLKQDNSCVLKAEQIETR